MLKPLLFWILANVGVPLTEENTPPPLEFPSYEGTFWKMCITILVVILCLFFVVWILKKFMGGKWNLNNGPKIIKVIEKRPISPKTMLYLVEIGRKQVLLSESQVEVRRLMDFDAGETEI